MGSEAGEEVVDHIVDCATRIPPREERVAEEARMDQRAQQRLTSDLRILVLLADTAIS